MGDWGFVDVLGVAEPCERGEDLGVEALPVAHGELGHEVGVGGKQFGGETGATEGAREQSATGTGEREEAPRLRTGLKLRENVSVDLDVLFDQKKPVALFPKLGQEEVVGVPRFAKVYEVRFRDVLLERREGQGVELALDVAADDSHQAGARMNS
jgi:hypothetical protein